MNAMKEYQIQDQKSAEFIQWFAKHQEHFCQTIVVEVTWSRSLFGNRSRRRCSTSNLTGAWGEKQSGRDVPARGFVSLSA